MSNVTTDLNSESDLEAELASRRRRKLTLWAGGGVALLGVAAVVIYIINILWPDPAAIKAKVDEKLGSYGCASLSSTVSPSREVTVKGHVGSADDLKRLKSEIEAVAGVGKATLEVAAAMYPHCEVAALPATFGPSDLAPPKLDLDPPSASIALEQFVKFTLESPPRDGFVLVDYYDRLGKVFHLLPGPAQPDNFRKAGTKTSIGEAKAGGRVYKIIRPLGQQLVSVIHTPARLDLGARPEEEDARTYLSALNSALTPDTRKTATITLRVFDIVER